MQLFPSDSLITANPAPTKGRAADPLGPASPATAILVPALRAQHRRAWLAMARIEADTPPDERGPLYASAARALCLAKRPLLARRALQAALTLDDPTATGLSYLWSGSGTGLGRGREMDGADAADAADAQCDRVACLVEAGRMHRARTAVERALSGCPHHAEARRWLDQLTNPLPLAHDLRPQPGLAWLSPCRLRRRVLGGLWTRPAPSHSPLRRLQLPGILTRVLGTDAPLSAEAALDHLATRLRTGLPVGNTAHKAWLQVRGLAPEKTLHAALWLCLLPPHDPGLVQVQRACAAVLKTAGIAPAVAVRRRAPVQLALPMQRVGTGVGHSAGRLGQVSYRGRRFWSD
ncbi:MAG: hypothetical protein GXP62_04495 [Oligoflexia bacterium]|nr:hypothetical protein [Oligoflexia bacterium]